MNLDWRPVHSPAPDSAAKILLGEQAATPFGVFHIRISNMVLDCAPDKSPYFNPFVLGHDKVSLGRFATAALAKEHALSWYKQTIKQLSCTSNT